MTGVWCLCIGPAHALSPTDVDGAQVLKMQINKTLHHVNQLRPTASFLWLEKMDVSRENSKTQQTCNNHPLKFIEAWNQINTLGKVREQCVPS